MTTCELLNNTDNAAAGRPYGANTCNPPYYGVYTTKKCQPCPTGCTMCNLYLTSEMPSPYGEINYTNYVWTNACAGDGLCTYALKCYSCNSSYVLE